MNKKNNQGNNHKNNHGNKPVMIICPTPPVQCEEARNKGRDISVYPTDIIIYHCGGST
ncbi:MAG: hypothetical protein IKB97_06610 [Bacteroidaceae bacterium]|nr:hypothetical protein [Bacteroidaceae bacterium]